MRTLEECEDLWTVAGLRKDGAEAPAGSAEEPLEPPGPARVGQPLLRVPPLVALEALPVVG